MSVRTKLSDTSVIALDTAAVAARARFDSGIAGEAGSKDALAQLESAVGELRAIRAKPHLQRALGAFNRDDFAGGEKWVLKALELDERNGLAWYLLAFARERAGDFASSLHCYESALSLLPDHAEVANDLGRLAFRLGMKEQAEKLFRHFLARYPDSLEAANNLACTIRDLARQDEAIEILRQAIATYPGSAILWNTLGSIVSEQGDFATARIFLEEALRLEPAFPKARHNLANACLSQGDLESALTHNDAALACPITGDERQMMRMLRSTILISLGRIAEGWEEYEARVHPDFEDVTLYQIDAPRWEPGDDVRGKRMLVVAEQGLGDEVLFANVLEDLVADLGSEELLTLAVEPRLTPLFQRSFPKAEVGAHATYKIPPRSVRVMPFLEDKPPPDVWSPMASLLRQYRTSIDAFPDRERFLTADPIRITHWRKVLEGAPKGRKVGLLWKSAIISSGRHRFFSPFEAWAPVLATPGVCFVNLQYGDCSVELEAARRDLGVEIWTPPGIDLKQDLDDVAALCCALDLVLGFSNASLNLGAACGAPTWLISVPGAWTRLGTADRYPWYPQARLFAPANFGAWDDVMAEIATALRTFLSPSKAD